MRSPLLLLLALALLLPGGARAEIYKYYDADGNLVLSDTVPKDRAEKVEKLKPRPIMTVPAVVPDRRAHPAPAADKDKPRLPEAGAYAIVVQSPVDGQTYPRGGDPVPVAISVSPGLAAGHRLDVRLDGQSAADLARIEPDRLDRGSHTLLVRVMDGAGKVLRASEVTFHIQQPSLQSPAAKSKPKPKH